MNITSCYAEIPVSDVFNVSKSSLYPATAVRLISESPEIAERFVLHERLARQMEQLDQAINNDVLVCSTDVDACLRCKPANELTAYIFKEGLDLALLAVRLEEMILSGDLREEHAQERYANEKKDIHCNMLREIDAVVPDFFSPFDIKGSLRTCN